MRYVLHISDAKGKPYVVEGPYEDYPTAQSAGMVFAKQGKYVTLELVDQAAICDFCSSPAVTWSYDVDDFHIVDRPEVHEGWGSTGGWAACDTCHDLIEAGDPEAVAMNSMQTFFKTHPEIPDQPEYRSRVYEHVRTVHSEFWKHKHGPGKHI